MKRATQIERERLRFVQMEIAAVTRLMEKANQVLEQPFGELKPDSASKMFLAAHNIGSAVLGLPALTVRSDLQPPPTAQTITNIIIKRDSQSDRTAKVYADFFRTHPSHPQSQRFVREYEELVAERAALGLPPISEDASQ